jgi:hypothetical protein
VVLLLQLLVILLWVLVGFIIAINIGEVRNIAIIETIMGFAPHPNYIQKCTYFENKTVQISSLGDLSLRRMAGRSGRWTI